MTIITKQITATAANATFLITIPNGVCSVSVSNGGNAAVIFGPAKSATSLTNTNGYLLPPNTVCKFEGYAASAGCDLYAIVAQGGTTQPVSALVSTTD